MPSRSLHSLFLRHFARYFAKLPLRYVLVVPLVLQVVAVISLVSYFSFTNERQAIDKLAYQLLEEVSDRIQFQVDAYLQLPYRLNQTSQTALQMDSLPDPTRLKQLFLKQLNTFPEIDYLAWGDRQGNYVDITRDANGKLTTSVVDRSIEKNFYPHYQNAVLSKSGEERMIAWNNTQLHNTQGKVIGTMSIEEDITQRQVIERMKDEFISVVSHELRTPLTAIQGSLGLLTAGIYDNQPDKAKRMLDIAKSQTERLVRLVNDILDLERLDSGKMALAKQNCDVAMLIQYAIDGIRAIAEENQITVVVSPLDVQVWADSDAIVQALINLISNAIKFSSPGTTIAIAAKLVGVPSDLEESEHWQPVFSDSAASSLVPPTHVCFQIKDQGRGIPADKLETIFGRFQQVDASDSREKGGTGLGLAICRSIIRQHGEHIWADSTPGEGSTFYFTLPIVQ